MSKPTLVLIDDEERILRSLSMLLRAQFRVHATTDPDEVLRLVVSEPVHLVISDQRMPRMRGAELLSKVRRLSPKTMRMLLTGYSEMEAAIAAVNEGEIFRYVNKPWDAAELRSTAEQAARIAQELYALPEAARNTIDATEPRPQIAAVQGSAAVAPAVASEAGRELETAALPTSAPASLLGEAAVLVIDEDPMTVESVRSMVGNRHPVHWARGLDQAFSMLELHCVGVIVSELNLRGDNLVPVLKLLKSQYPEVVSIVLTSFQDSGVLIGLINQAQVFRLLPKPLREGPFGMSLASALRHHDLMRRAPWERSRHVVEALRPSEETGLTTRIRGFLSRLGPRVVRA